MFSQSPPHESKKGQKQAAYKRRVHELRGAETAEKQATVGENFTMAR